MLQHMAVVYGFQSILARVNERAVVTKVALEHECARIAVAISGGVIRACISALGENVANIAILLWVSTVSLGSDNLRRLYSQRR